MERGRGRIDIGRLMRRSRSPLCRGQAWTKWPALERDGPPGLPEAMPSCRGLAGIVWHLRTDAGWRALPDGVPARRRRATTIRRSDRGQDETYPTACRRHGVQRRESRSAMSCKYCSAILRHENRCTCSRPTRFSRSARPGSLTIRRTASIHASSRSGSAYSAA